jgi:copper chaperone CopZ
MRKVTFLTLPVVLAFAILISPAVVNACGNKGGDMKMGSVDLKKSSKMGTYTAKSGNVTGDVTSALVTFSVKGMTCGGCENEVKTALQKHEGVVEVVKVDYQSDKAVVKYDPKKVETAELASAVTRLGYETSVMPAVDNPVEKNNKEAKESPEKKKM